MPTVRLLSKLALVSFVLTVAPLAAAQDAPKLPESTAGSDANAPLTKASAKPAADNTNDVTEKPGVRYIYVGLRYRGDIVPQFMLNAFVSEGKTFYSNMIGLEADIRKDDFSLIPALTYQSYGTGGPVLFLQKGQDATNQGYWSAVDSSMKAIFATVDLMWSTKVSPNIDFEYGAGFGIGFVFGGLTNNWVYSVPAGTPGSITASSPAGGYTNFAQCGAPGAPPDTNGINSGCNPMSHSNPSPPHVYNGSQAYQEKSWFNGGAKPSVLPWIALPELGLRFKPIPQLVGRVQLGFSLTGFWFGVSADYGLPNSNSSSGGGTKK